MESRMDSFFNFESFISIETLKVFYIFGVIALPVMSWFFLLWVINKYSALFRFYKGVKRSIIISIIVWVMSKIKFFKKYVDEKVTWGSLGATQKLKFILLFIMLVFFSELFYRLVFEYLIGFMQMHDALVG